VDWAACAGERKRKRRGTREEEEEEEEGAPLPKHGGAKLSRLIASGIPLDSCRQG